MSKFFSYSLKDEGPTLFQKKGGVADFIDIQKEINRRESKLMELITSAGYQIPEPRVKTNQDILSEGTYDISHPDCDCDDY